MGWTWKWIVENSSIDQEYIKVETEDAVIDKIIVDSGKGLIAEITLSIIEEGEIILIEVKGLIIEVGVDQEMIMGMEEMTGLIIDKVTEEKISDKSMVSKDIELEV